MYICIYVGMTTSMYCLYVRVDYTYMYTNALAHVCMYVCIDVCICVCVGGICVVGWVCVYHYFVLEYLEHPSKDVLFKYVIRQHHI